MKITEHTTVADIVSTVPSSVRVFQRHGIDFCCGGRTPLTRACQERGVAFGTLVEDLEAAAQEPASDERDWSHEPLHALIEHIVSTYHAPLREELPRLAWMATKVARVHGDRASYLARLETIVAELSADLGLHMQKEEMVLFPAIAALEAGQDHPPMPLWAPISVMENEHEHAGALLSKLRTMTGDYAAPAWACATFRALYQGLSELEAEMHEHVHLENNILFPRALALTAGADRVRVDRPL